MTLKVLLKYRHIVRSLIDRYPSIYLPVCRVRLKTRQVTVSKDTEIVIEGSPRSANTFAVAAFAFAQGRPVKIARHLHAPAQVIAATKRRIPCIVLIRKPRDAVLSLLVRAPHISAEQALKDYIRFYRSVYPYRDKFVVGRFEEATTDFSEIIRRVNARFGTNFKLFEHTEENLQKVFQIVEEMDKQDTGLGEVKEETVARPSTYREKLKKMAEAKLETPKARKLLLEAEEVYRMFIEAREDVLG
ncbi:MAG: hypothetical protein DRG83_14655 [Deltaproteobacteria bacterium]|nr:MAG: hypothetical protein DRG83_14655 [Deltaproteobacteria bacterium]RLG37770.1 MAG: hypothetical protein DRN91_04540 [Candidatus Alkanophagales archaeon]